jgi:hypothetical protein
MEAATVKAHGKRVGKGKHTGVVWSYNGSLWMILKKNDKFAYLWGRDTAC